MISLFHWLDKEIIWRARTFVVVVKKLGKKQTVDLGSTPLCGQFFNGPDQRGAFCGWIFGIKIHTLAKPTESPSGFSDPARQASVSLTGSATFAEWKIAVNMDHVS